MQQPVWQMRLHGTATLHAPGEQWGLSCWSAVPVNRMQAAQPRDAVFEGRSRLALVRGCLCVWPAWLDDVISSLPVKGDAGGWTPSPDTLLADARLLLRWPWSGLLPCLHSSQVRAG